ncbi:MAG: homoserine kinase [Rhodoferax ferrireducens]|uniref:Homoserine kinase n=1 Tax=Rhodoferax ferrireducens TaxID=192843 RepID=A0A1W9KYN4_9BURK|nr:MAG: homoserine kinase [Rhodoferax ferrireducens]
MAVYTEVSEPEARTLLRGLGLGELTDLRPCAGGIENTNYFASTERAGQAHDYVLTLFERLTFEQLQFYLRLMKHLAQRGIAVPEPHANASGALVFEVKGKPAAVVDKLRGKSEANPTGVHCAQVGARLAQLHLAGQDFELTQPNLRALPWWNEVVPVVLPHLSDSQKELIQSELTYQNSLATQPGYAALPRGPIHADLFRDNVMFDTLHGQPTLSGFFDFYFAGVDSFVFDLAVCLNDWCIDPTTGVHHAQRAHAFIAAYNAVRPLQDNERDLLPAMLRAAALRFWVSRLWDFYLPRAASVLQAHDPAHFERVLQQRAHHPLTFDQLARTA